MFTDQIDLKDIDSMDPEYKDLLGRVMTIQADCEIGGPHLYVKDILPNAPSRIDKLIVARTAAEELDHYRKFSKIAADIGVDVSFVLSRENKDRYLEAFRGIINTWEDFAAFGMLIDRVGKYQLSEFNDCSYLPLQRILPDIHLEEEGHLAFGTNKVTEMANKNDESREKIQNAINFWYVKGLDMFGHSESPRSERYRYWGLKRRSNKEARESYKKECDALILSVGLEIPSMKEKRNYE